MISRIGQARGRPVGAGLRQVRRDHAPLRVSQVRLVSRDGAIMMLSVVGVHMANPRLARESPCIHGGRHNSTPFQKPAADKSRLNGTTDWFAGDFADARVSLKRALAIFDPERDSDLAFRFAQDLGVSITAYLALVLWPLGEVDRAREVADEMVARATKIGHIGTAVYGHFHFAMFEMMRRNPPDAAASNLHDLEYAAIANVDVLLPFPPAMVASAFGWLRWRPV